MRRLRLGARVFDLSWFDLGPVSRDSLSRARIHEPEECDAGYGGGPVRIEGGV